MKRLQKELIGLLRAVSDVPKLAGRMAMLIIVLSPILVINAARVWNTDVLVVLIVLYLCEASLLILDVIVNKPEASSMKKGYRFTHKDDKGNVTINMAEFHEMIEYLSEIEDSLEGKHEE